MNKIITYVVTIWVKNPKDIAAWIKWMLEVHIPSVKKTGMLLSNSGQIFAKESVGTATQEYYFEVHYYFDSLETLEAYRTKHGAALNKEYVGEGYGNTADGMNDGKAPAVSRHALTTNSAIAGISTVDPVRDHKLKFLMQKIDEPFTFFGETKSRKLLTSVVNVLRLVRIQYWFEMFFLQEEQAKKYRGLGKKGLREIKETFAKQNIPFDMKKGYITMLPLRNKVYRSDEKCCDIQMFVNSDAWKNFCALLAPNVAKYSITIGDFTEEYGRFHSYRMNSDNQKLYLPGTTDNQLSDARCDMDDLIKKHYISRMEVFVQKVPLE